MCTLLSGLVVHSMGMATAEAGSQAAGIGNAYRALLRKRLGSAELADCRSGIMTLRCLVSRLAREELQARAPSFPHMPNGCGVQHAALNTIFKLAP